jgi:hypothetical protein
MSDTTSTSTGAYRLHAPARQLYDPSTLEQIYAKELFTPGTGGLAVGYMLGAEADRRQSANDYNLALDRVNAQQSAIAQQRIRGDMQGEQYKLIGKALEHPSYMSLFPAITGLMDPEREPIAAQLSPLANERVSAQAFEDRAQGVGALGAVGAAPPPGTAFDPTGRPSAPIVQGQHPTVAAAALRASGDRGGVRDSTVARVMEMYARRPEMIEKEVNAQHRHLLRMRGIERDINGQTIRGPQLTPEDEASVLAEARQRAEAAVTNSLGMMEHVARAGGMGHLVPPTSRPGTPGYFLNPQPAAPIPGGTVTAPNLRTGGTVQLPPEVPGVTNGPGGITVPGSTTRPPASVIGTAQAAPPPPPSTPRPAPPAATETGTARALSTQDTLLRGFSAAGHPNPREATASAMQRARAIPNAHSMDVIADGTVRVFDRNNNVVGRIPPQ